MGIFRRSARRAQTRQSTITIGVPGRCPECDGFGYIDNIDVVHRHQEQHCIDCGHRWEFRFDEDGVLIERTEEHAELDLTGEDAVIDLADDETIDLTDEPEPEREPALAPAPAVTAEAPAEKPTDAHDYSPADWLRI